LSVSFNEKARRGVARQGGLSVSLWSADHSRDGGAVVIPERFLGSFEPRRAFRFVNVVRRPTIDGSPTPSPIFVAPKPIPEEEWTRLCEQYGHHQTRVLAGDALLIDLRGDEPTFGSVPLDYKPPEVGT
jgi:hypothetical protein